jgi:hypothetical protein
LSGETPLKSTVAAAMPTALYPIRHRPDAGASGTTASRKHVARNQVLTNSASLSVTRAVPNWTPIPCPERYANGVYDAE